MQFLIRTRTLMMKGGRRRTLPSDSLDGSVSYLPHEYDGNRVRRSGSSKSEQGYCRLAASDNDIDTIKTLSIERYLTCLVVATLGHLSKSY